MQIQSPNVPFKPRRTAADLVTAYHAEYTKLWPDTPPLGAQAPFAGYDPREMAWRQLVCGGIEPEQVRFVCQGLNDRIRNKGWPVESRQIKNLCRLDAFLERLSLWGWVAKKMGALDVPPATRIVAAWRRTPHVPQDSIPEPKTAAKVVPAVLKNYLEQMRLAVDSPSS